MSVWMKYLRDILIGAAAFLLTAYSRGLMHGENLKEILGVLSDCFVIPGVFLSGGGFLAYSARLGMFDMLASCASNLLGAHKGKNEDFYCYKCRHASMRSQYYGMLWLGLGALLLSGLFLIGYILV